MKKIVLAVLVLIWLPVAGCGASGVPQEEYDALLAERDAFVVERDATIVANNALEQRISDLEAEIRAFDVMRQTYIGLSEAELLAQTEAANLKAEQDRQEKERLLAEEQAAREKKEAEEMAALEAEAKKGYNTGITYDNLARSPGDYEGKKVKFTGRVVQVVESSGFVDLRIATKGNYDNVIYVHYLASLTSTRVLEGDKITIYGVSEGLYSYTSTMGAPITIPLVAVDKIDQ